MTTTTTTATTSKHCHVLKTLTWVILLLIPSVTSFQSSHYRLRKELFSSIATTSKVRPCRPSYLQVSQRPSDDSQEEEDKLSFGQRIESIKSAVVGGISGSVGVVPFTALHDLVLDDYKSNGIAQWEFDTDMAALQGALFAIVYRYCVRQNDNNPMLNQGVIGAFVLIRTLSRIRIPSYCSAVPLDCGAPLGYFDWSMLGQVIVNGLESAVLFGAASWALEYCFQRGFISKFP